MNYFKLKEKIKNREIGNYSLKELKQERNKIYLKQALIILASIGITFCLPLLPFTSLTVGMLMCTSLILGTYGVWYYNDLKQELNNYIDDKKKKLRLSKNLKEFSKENNKEINKTKVLSNETVKTNTKDEVLVNEPKVITKEKDKVLVLKRK